MSSEIKKEIELEIAHVLFLDIIAYSKLLINEQRALVDQLNQVVRSSEAFRSAEAAGRLIKIPTGDGMALVFYKSPEQPVECALEISRDLKTHPELRVRMGVHSGPVSAVIDVNDRASVAGAGINIAQRVMDCGDIGHILLSKRVAEDLEQSGHWQSLLHDLGEVEVKHGARVHVFNLYTEDLGNPEMPEKLRQAKEQTAPATAAAGYQQSIAVLPFSDMSPARDHDWFCEGIAEEILNALTKLPGLRVATRTSAFRFKDPARDLCAIGATLGVTTLLEGSVRTAGSRLRVTAQLVNASDGYQLWSERFDRQMEDVFEIQDQIARKVVEALELRLIAPSGALGEPRHSHDIEAYHLFLKGRYFRYTKLDLKSARRCFEEAIARDPAYALAHIMLAETLAFLVFYGVISPSVGQPKVREELRQARELSGESAHALGIEAYLALVYDWDTRASLEAFERSLGLDPTSIPVRAWYTWSLLAAERTEEAVQQARQIMQLDPQSSYANVLAGDAQLMAGRLEEALALHRRAVEIAPDSLLTAWNFGMSLAAASAWDEAKDWIGKAVGRSSRAPFFMGVLAWTEAASGRQEQARQILGELERRAATEYVSPLSFAMALKRVGRAREDACAAR